MYRIALIGFALFATGCEEEASYAALDTGMEESLRAASMARSVTITVKDNEHHEESTDVKYDLPNGEENEWRLVGQCDSDAWSASGGSNGALAGCTLTCNNFNEDGECDDCDIDCSVDELQDADASLR